MADKTFKANDPITVKFQAVGGRADLTVQMDVFDTTDAKVLGQCVVMAPVADAPGAYSAAFTPNAEGDWLVRITDSGGGKAIKSFSVGPVNLKDVATTVNAVGNAVVTVDGKADAINAAVGGVAAAVADMRTVVNAIQTQVGTLGDSQAMIG
ncbi:MAG: hypothetical protein EHM35_00785 [Planctomycetaceae bacterium]|nr:MAG: hypothetical protein EHM35_00785 [Planctomycetaceae bacterium]